MKHESTAVTPRHWLVLAVATFVAASGSAFVVGVGFLLPHLTTVEGLSLSRAGVLVAMPLVGMATALIAWGWLVDRTSEKLVLVSGSVGAALALTAALFVESFTLLAILLLVTGAFTASGNSASGRLVVSWFPAHRRGLAMGVRQMSQPAGSAVAAMTMPLLAQSYGLAAAFAVPLAMAVVSAVAALVVVTDPPGHLAAPPPAPSAAAPRVTGTASATRPPSDGSPYRGSGYLARVHGASVLLVLPQGMLQAFLLAWLVLGHGWSAVSAGIVVTASQVLGAVARIVAGAVSDRVGSRMRPLRAVAISVTGGLAALAVAEALGAPGVIAVTLGVVATVLSVSDNGLAFTAVAEYAGPRWSGRALGVQNTAQFVAIAASTPLVAAVIEAVGYWPVFAGAAVVAAVAIPLVPRADVVRV
ncbi:MULTISPECIES: MFS transporter [Dietzia]|uniref:MFS transporter n=1 Tax=Dietzia TaxID=37914 RepID=UPI0020B13E60|nr:MULTISPECIES: MFS transporter [Dietzia]MCT1432840.1 MFS transporter [Dietzia maris]MCT1520295.1 MFS transporter [Dietzia maris]